MKRKQIKKQNIFQLVLSVAIILLTAYLLSFVYYRFDLTSEKRYTLSSASNEILENLDDVIFVKVYLEGDLNVGFARMRNSIKELLDEFKVIAEDNIEFEFVNPSENPDPKLRNAVYTDLYNKGLKPSNIHERDSEGKVIQKLIFPGAIVSLGVKEIAIDLLINNQGKSGEENLNNSIQLLEYNLINGIYKIIAQKNKTIAFIEGHGELDEYETGDITEELSAFYNIHRVKIDGKQGFLKSYSTIIIAKPQLLFPEEDKLAIDQYIMNGGKVLWLIDPVQVSMDSLSYASSTLAYIRDLNLDDQLFKYGVRINPNLVQDLNCAVIPVNVAATGRQSQFAPAPWLYNPLIDPSNEHFLTRNLNFVKSEFASVIDTVGSNKDVKKLVLLKTSEYSNIINVPIVISLKQIASNPDPNTFNSRSQPIAVLMEGSFESVFTNRLISHLTKNDAFKLVEKSEPTKMIVIADGDIIKNHIRRQSDGIMITPLGYDRYTKKTYGNKEFIMNAVNYLNDEKGLMEMRSRELKLRLLNKTKVQKERFKWQMVNIALPVVLVVLFGLIVGYIRKKKYA